MEWTTKKILYFIKRYRNKPVLWDPQDPHHYNKLKKHVAWKKLAAEFKTTEEECKRKITSLLASLRREKAKVAKSKTTGKGAKEVYESNWFAYKALEFVLDRNKPRSAIDTIETKPEFGHHTVEEMGTTVNETGETDETISSETASNDDECHAPHPKKIKKNVQSTEEMMASSNSVLKNSTQKSETATRPAIDECESFGLFVSNKLRNYSQLTRSTAEHYISKILFDADQGRYNMVYPRMDVRCQYGQGQSHTRRPQSSASTYSTHAPSISPQPSLQSQQHSVRYVDASAECDPSGGRASAPLQVDSPVATGPRSSTPLLPLKQDEHTQES